MTGTDGGRGVLVSPPVWGHLDPCGPTSGHSSPSEADAPGEGGARATDREAEATRPAGTPLVVGHRVDALRVAFKLELQHADLVALSSANITAASTRHARVVVSGIEFAMQPRQVGGGQFLLRNTDADVVVGPTQHGWDVVVDFRAVYLATHTLDECKAQAVALATHFLAEGDSIQATRVRRLDLACDIAGVSFAPEDLPAFVGKTRSKARFDRHATRTFTNRTDSMTGITFSAGNAIMCRIYDKLLELEQKASADSEKSRTEHSAWRDAGWDGSEPVWRIEFQLRRDGGLETFDLETLGQVSDVNLDAIWGYLTEKWLRLADLKSATRKKRCAPDPRWVVVQLVQWAAHRPPAAKREHGRRGGAQVPQALGTVLSTLAASHRLPDYGHGERDGNLLLNECLSKFADMARADTKLVRTMGERVAGYGARFASLDDSVEPSKDSHRQPQRPGIASAGRTRIAPLAGAARAATDAG